MFLTYEGYLERDRFYPIGPPLKIKGRRKVFVTILDEQVDQSSQEKAWGEFFAAIDAASDEEIPETFEKVNFSREIDL